MKQIHCEGAPRDLGHDQGRALRDEIRAAAGCATLLARLRARRRDPASARLRRDLRRYFPHQSEWLEGMARASGVPLRALLRALASAVADDAPPAAALAAGVGGAMRLACSAPPGTVLRHVAPEGRFASAELALPAATWPLAGVNEAGLALAVLPRGSVPGRFAAPAALFARDCLERFERVEPALEWCLSRPAAAGGALLLADARGGLVGVDAAAAERRAIPAVGGWLALGGAGHEPPAWQKRGQLADAGAAESALVASLVSVSPAGAPVSIDPPGRRLRVAGGEWIAAA